MLLEIYLFISLARVTIINTIYLFVCQRVLTLDFQVKPVNFIILIQKKGLIEQMQ